MGFPGYDVDADQFQLPAVSADTKKSAGPQPKAAPSSSVEMLKALVDDARSAVAPLRGDVDHQFASAERIISVAAEHIAGRIPAVTAALKANPGDVGQVSELLQQLDSHLKILFMVARRHGISLRGAHLDAVFDAEDMLRQAGGETALYRADNYYDETGFGDQGTKKQAQDPTTETLNSGEEAAVAQPKNRAELIDQIISFSTLVRDAMELGRKAAEGVINEPDKPKSPELIEVILDMALDFAIGAATGMAGTLIKDMMKGAPKVHISTHEKGGGHGHGHAKGAEPEADEDLGHAMIEALADSLKEASKGAINPTIAYAHAPKEGEGNKEGGEGKAPSEGSVGTEKTSTPDKGLSIKTQYLQLANEKTTQRMGAVTKQYAQAKGQLLRMPVSTLQSLAAAFTDELTTRIKEETTSHIVDGWVVVGRQAYGEGEYVGDPSQRPSGTKLDAPVGMCEIWLTATGPNAEHLQFRGAHLPYQTDAVLKNIQQQNGSLADFAVDRSVRVAGIALNPFYVKPDGRIDDAALKYMSADELVAYANLAKAAERKEGGLESAAMAGMYKVLQALHSIPRSRITQGWS